MPRRLTSARFWLEQLGLATVWVVAWQVGRLLEYAPHASLWFPPAGVSFAAFLVGGGWACCGVLIASIVTTFHAAWIYGGAHSALETLGAGLAFGTAHSLAYGLGALLHERSHLEARLGTPRGVVGFLLAATLSASIAALLGSWSLVLTGFVSRTEVTGLFVPWWIGDLVGVVALAPLFVILAEGASRRLGLRVSGWGDSLRGLSRGPSSRAPFLLKLASALALAVVLTGAAAVPDLNLPVALVVYALIVPLMWIAHTEGAWRTVVAIAWVATAVVVTTRVLGLTEQAFDYQAAMIAIAATGLFNLTVPRLYADNERLRELVTTDQLTGARTRQVLHEVAEREVDRARRLGSPLSILTFDLDRFKWVNDTFGHAAGDQVLARVGQSCRVELRTMDLFGRIGGEEFAIVLPASSLAAASEVAERLRAALERERYGFADGQRVTASFGVVQVDTDEPFGAALRRADQALYEAKRAGRNRVVGG